MTAFLAEFCLILGLIQLIATHFRLRGLSLTGPRWGWGYAAGALLTALGLAWPPRGLAALWLAVPASLLAIVTSIGVASLIPPEPEPEAFFRNTPRWPRRSRPVSIPDGAHQGPGLLLFPERADAAAVCLIHGSSDHKTSFHWRLIDALLRQNLTVLTIDLPGHGAYRHRPMAHPDALSVIPAAVAFLRQQPGLERIGLLGISLGGAFALRAVADGLRVEALAVLETPTELVYNARLVRREVWATLRAPVVDFLQDVTALKIRKLWRGDRYVGDHRVEELIRRLNPLEAATHLAGTPTLLLYGGRDPVAPRNQAWALQQAAPQATARIEPGLSHVTLILHRPSCAFTAGWLRQNLDRAPGACET